MDSGLHRQFHPYGSPHHSPHRGHSPHQGHSPHHSPHRQSSNSSGHTLTVPHTLPLPLQNYITNQNSLSSPPHTNHLLTSMDSLSVNSGDVMLGSSPGAIVTSEQHLLSPVQQQQQQQTGATHNGLVNNSHHHHQHHQHQQHQHHPSSNQIQPKIVISSEISSNSMDMNCHDRRDSTSGNLASPSSQTSRMCSKDAEKSPQGSPLGYRSSQSDCPASPNSPCSPHSFSPAQSPGLPATSSTVSGSPCSAFADNYYMQHQQQQAAQQQTNALQHQFEQFNMHKFFPALDNPELNTAASMYQNMVNQQLQYSQANNALSGTPNFMNHTQHHQQQQHHQNHYYKQTTNGLHNSPNTQQQQQPPSSPHQSPHPPSSPQLPPSPQSPHNNTTSGLAPSPTQLMAQEDRYSALSPHMSPASQNNQPNTIPDIILTGELETFLCGADDSVRQDFAKEIGNAMVGMHDVFGDSDLLASDEALKDGLAPLDFSELQMLTDPSMITDSATEDSFRLDRL